MEPGDDQLPKPLAALWGTQDQSEPERRERLSVERIVTAAVELADAGGLEAVSMSRVAERLEFSTMALYRHVASKDDLLVLMLNAALAPPRQVPGHLVQPWRPGLERWSSDVLAQLRRHPWILCIPITGPPATPSQLAWLDRGLQALADTALTEAEKAALMLALNGLVFWGARLFAELDRAAESGDIPADPELISHFADGERFPALRRALDAGIFADQSLDTDYKFGIERLLDGVERLLEQRAKRT